MKTTMNKLLALLAPLVFAATALLATPAQAGGGISIPLPPLPPIPHIKLPAPPLMVWLPTPAVHVALDSPYPIFAHDNRYYLHSNNAWYVGPSYAGPWAFVHVHLLPPGLRHYRGHEWDHYQHQARYWHHHEHRAHPHFYGHRRIEHFESRVPLSHRDHIQPPREHRTRHDDRGWAHHQPPARTHGRDHSRGTQTERAYDHGHARLKGHDRGRDMVRAQVHGDGRKHGNNHWRLSY